MEHKKLSKEFKEYLDSLNTDFKTNKWVFIGKTNDAFGSPGGSWQGQEGYKFKEEKSNQEYLLRSIPENGYIVLESYSTRRQVYNMDLSKATIHQSKNNKSILLESYTMTAGKGRVKKQDVKDAFKKIGVNTNQIAEISDSNPKWADLVESLLTWAYYREEVKKLLKSNNESKLEDTDVEQIKSDQHYGKNPLNQILFGPPGTGKTYTTINKAVAIVDNLKESALKGYYEERSDLKERFDELLIDDWENPNGQIGFVTFHQSMSYEDFIEGIKPGLNDEQNVIYDIEPGVFKMMASIARDNWLDANKGTKEQLSFEEAFTKFKEEWQENQEMKFPLKREGSEYTILGFTKSSIKFKKASGGTGHTLSISTLRDYFYKRREVRQTGVGIYYPAILDKLKSYQPSLIVEKEEKNYVLIIDEINRGNVSQIFGELITLIEEDKRLGKAEALEVTLPYSKEKFGVPPNLYIIGTMNTADRSVEALDTALRRRFSFTEMPPRYELSGLDYEFAGVKGHEILIKINKRIEKLLDRDHLIGHSYFLLNEEEKLNPEPKLLDSFYRNIIPLLQEYFFGDYAKIGAVLGNGFVYAENENDQADFATGYENEDFAEKDIFQIIDYRSEQPGQPEMSFEKAIRLLMNQTLTD